MAQDQIPGSPPGPEKSAHSRVDPRGMPDDRQRGRHDIVDDDESFFWPEVDDLLTADFSSEMGALRANLANGDDQQLGLDPASDLGPSSGNGGRSGSDGSGPNHGAMPPTAPSPRISGGFAPDPSLFGYQQETTPAAPAVPDGLKSSSLFAELEALPDVARDEDAGLLFGWSGPDGQGERFSPEVSSATEPGSRLDASQLDFPSEPKLSTSPTAPPVSLAHSTVVDQVHGHAPGSSFSQDHQAQSDRYRDQGQQYEGRGFDQFRDQGHGQPPASDRQGGGLLSEHTAASEQIFAPGPNEPVSGTPPHLIRPPGSAYVPASPWDVVRDIVDRQWFASALIGTLAVVLGVVGWVVLSGDEPGPDLISGPGASGSTQPATDSSTLDSSATAGPVATSVPAIVTSPIPASATPAVTSAPPRRTTTTAAQATTSTTDAATSSTDDSTTSSTDASTTTSSEPGSTTESVTQSAQSPTRPLPSGPGPT